MLASVLDRGAGALRAAGIEQPRMEARLLLAGVMGVPQEDVIGERAVPNVQALVRYEASLARRVAREPLAYILGEREFWSLPFAVGPGVLVPRPESEILVSEALREFPACDTPLDVLDLGTGSGCLLLSFLHERPNAQGIGVDISRQALSWAARNASDLGLSPRAAFLLSSWMDDVSDRFDAIFINPPYVALDDLAKLEPELSYEPVAALSGGHDGFDAYRQIAPQLAPALKPGGRLFVEIGAGQGERVAAVLGATGFRIVRFVPDLAGIPRCLVLERTGG